MPQIYKIYINEIVLILTHTIPSDIEDYQEVKSSDFRFSEFYEHAKQMNRPKIFVIRSREFKSLFRNMKRSMQLIKAAGGLVKNEEEKYLFIFRNGKWDLPKGKIEEGEKTRLAAIREVEEECGIRIQKSGKKICNTYHIYEFNNERVLKKTSWYKMKAENQNELIPQLEEGITDVRWLGPGDLMMVKQNTYPLVRDLISPIG
jgi:8-oxo-dGTP pyrophosphatase MutT (NUDIX family)